MAEMSLKDYEDEIVNSCVEYTNTTSDLYYCMMSELYGMKRVINFLRLKGTYTDDQWMFLTSLFGKYPVGKGFDWVSIDMEFKDYLKNNK